MECSDAEVWISARIDGEQVLDPVGLDRHVDGCASCREFEGANHRLKRSMAFRPVELQPIDLAQVVLQKAGAPNLGAGEWKRTLLAAAGLTLLLLSIPGVLFGSSMLGTELGSSEHLGRHLGAFSAALAFGFVYAAWRPERAVGLMPFTSALGVLILLTGVIDMVRGSSTSLAEASHVLELVGILLVWEISGGRRHLPTRLNLRNA